MKKIAFLVVFTVGMCGFLFAQEPNKVELLPIEHHDGLYWKGSKAMTNAEYFGFIQKNCPDAYNSYKKGCELWKNGIIVGAVGIGAFAIGCGMLVAAATLDYSYYNGYMGYYNYSNIDALYIAGSVALSAGALMQVAAIPLMTVGGLKKWGSRRVYNNNCARMSQVSLNLQSSNKGVGLSLHF